MCCDCICTGLVFGFDPDTYSASEDVGAQVLNVRLISGNAGAFQFILDAATDDSSATATAIGKYHFKL